MGEYVLNIKPPTIPSAARGNVAHKIWQLLAMQKRAMQDGLEEFDSEDFGILKIVDCTPQLFLDLSYKYYVEITPEVKWTDADYKECKKLMDDGLAFGGGAYNPLNHTVVAPEQRFSIKLEEEWASYDYELNGQKLKGQLILNGTIDLLCELSRSPLIWELIDLKSGAKRSWSKNQDKDFKSLQTDGQLLFYYFALRKLYPQVEQIVISIFYIKHGPTTMYYGDKEYKLAEQMIKDKFEKIKKIKHPRLNIDWRCKKFCYFGKTLQEGTNKTICEHLKSEVKEKGIQKVTEEYVKDAAVFSRYGAGGGRNTVE